MIRFTSPQLRQRRRLSSRPVSMGDAALPSDGSPSLEGVALTVVMPSAAAGYAAATDNLRTATRWLLTAAAVAGAAMVAGLQLTSIGSLGAGDWPRLVSAAAGLAGALGAVGYMIFRTSRLLTDEWITLAHLELAQFRQRLHSSRHRRDKKRAAAIDHIYEELQTYRDELYGSVAESISDLYSRLIQANDAARKRPSLAQVQTAAALRSAVDTTVQAANYSYTRSDFAALRKDLARAAAVFVAGVVLFAYAANPPKTAAASGHTTPARQAASVASGWAYFSPGLGAARWAPRGAGKIRSRGG